MEKSMVVSAVRVYLGRSVRNCVNRPHCLPQVINLFDISLNIVLITTFFFFRKVWFSWSLHKWRRTSGFMIFVTFYDRARNQPCITSFTTTLDMRRKQVFFGSKVGNTTNPQFLDVDTWVTWWINTCHFIFMNFDGAFVSRLCTSHTWNVLKY